MNAIMVVYFEQLQILYNAGARNFVLLSVPRKCLHRNRGIPGRSRRQ